MTILAVYKEKDESIFLSDFRVTLGKERVQKDISNKFIPLNSKMGFFLAGNVDVGKKVINEIRTKMEDITFDNILKSEGPLNAILKEFTFFERPKKCEILGFILDENTKQNKVFHIEIEDFKKVILEEIKSNSCVIKGAGKSLTNLNFKIINILQGNEKIFEKYDSLRSKSSVMEEVVKKAILQYSDNGFEELGISPTFQIAYLRGSSFIIESSENEGGSYTKEYGHTFKYSFGEENGNFYLEDIITGQKNQLLDIDNVIGSATGGKFNPENI